LNSGMSDQDQSEKKDALFLIREEIAIMKKLNHPNLVQLIEVLDDPEEDSLYMVLEMCKKGVIMKVGINEPADPYPEESCRYWFRDLILGIEYCMSHPIPSAYVCATMQLLDRMSDLLWLQCMHRAWYIEISSRTTCC
jgi:calcium/calmodulin-dependent protein kinase kinase 2